MEPAGGACRLHDLLRKLMNFQIEIGGIRFSFDSDDEILVDESLSPFFCTSKKVSGVNISISRSAGEICPPETAMRGEDLLLEYYDLEGSVLCLAKGSSGRYLASTVCSPDFSRMECRLSLHPEASMHTLGTILRMLPIRTVLQRRGVLFFHASQVAADGKGILFTAPSGTGKTTQAKLWRDFRGARMICNDRTLIRSGMTYGYPVDGSEPVISGEVHPLAAVVLLEQAPENRVRRLRVKEVLTKLMPQLVIDTWDPNARALASQQLLELMGGYPVYLLGCTPDEAAVSALEQQLRMDGVL